MRRGFQADPCLSHVARWIGAAGERLHPERETAERFLKCLDSAARGFSFRTFSDTPYTREGGFDPLERAIHGSLDACWETLVALNRMGAAIAVTVNQTNGRGRAVEDIQRVRALFLDDDRDGDPHRFGLLPHMQVMTSRGHNHYYWLVEALPVALFGRLQRQLAMRFGGDTRVCALNQAMQLPGFWRRKRINQPRLPNLLLHHHGAAFHTTELQALLGGSDR